MARCCLGFGCQSAEVGTFLPFLVGIYQSVAALWAMHPGPKLHPVLHVHMCGSPVVFSSAVLPLLFT